MNCLYKLIQYKIYILILLTFSIQAEENLPEWKKILKTLNTEEKTFLESFFKTMMVNSEGGFVLFGSKPACVEGCLLPEKCQTTWMGRRDHRRSIDLAEGFLVWKKHFNSLHSKKLIICCKDHADNTYSDWIHLIWINPQKIINVVTKNLSLFQYVMGANMTPSLFLEHLANPSKDLPKDYALTGIILGFGTRNSLFYRRLELIEKKLYSREQLPLKTKYERLNIPDPFPGLYLGFDQDTECELEPSFDYSVLSEEYEALERKGSGSIQLAPGIPLFAIYDKDKETMDIIANYKDDQIRIQKLLSEQDFLEKTLRLIFE